MKPKLYPKLESIPFAPVYKAGFLTTKNSGWRSKRPVIDNTKCNSCYLCYLYCPDGVIYKLKDKGVAIDYDFCKGCGICQKICKKGCFSMESEK